MKIKTILIDEFMDELNNYIQKQIIHNNLIEDIFKSTQHTLSLTTVKDKINVLVDLSYNSSRLIHDVSKAIAQSIGRIEDDMLREKFSMILNLTMISSVSEYQKK